MPQICFKCSTEEYGAIKEAAEDLSLAVSAFCRSLIKKNLPDRLPRHRNSIHDK